MTMVPRAGGIAPRNIACTGWVNSFIPSARKKMKLQVRRKGGHGLLVELGGRVSGHCQAE